MWHLGVPIGKQLFIQVHKETQSLGKRTSSVRLANKVREGEELPQLT